MDSKIGIPPGAGNILGASSLSEGTTPYVDEKQSQHTNNTLDKCTPIPAETVRADILY
uniref:Uncharacterized protein n=1 Tax=Physcomitrium patens TaxID=3218 RepID=A0A2K1KG75_PHYPA|nr:hypothetical protein PHYPA_009134 [Physcomitrium patens]